MTAPASSTGVPLRALAHARSGDKGSGANIGLIAYEAQDYPLLCAEVTADRVRSHLEELVAGRVERFELPNLHALNFVLHDALGGGGTISLRTDAQGKVLANALLRMEIAASPEVARRVRGRGLAPVDEAGSGDGGDVVVRDEPVAGVVRLTLNRPRRRNALNGSMVETLTEILAGIDADPAVRVVVLQGAGEDFCAGADLGEIAESQTRDPLHGLADADRLAALFLGIRHLRQPVVALVTGRALGGGCGLATACDLVLARDDARFGYPEVHLGFVPALVMSFLRGRVGEANALELLILGRTIDATEADRIGLANRVIASADFESESGRYLNDLRAVPAAAAILTKRLFHGQTEAALHGTLARAAEINAIARLTGECRQGVGKFLAQRGSHPKPGG